MWVPAMSEAPKVNNHEVKASAHVAADLEYLEGARPESWRAVGTGSWLTPWGQKTSPGEVTGQGSDNIHAGPSQTPALSSSSLLGGNVVLPGKAHNALLHEAPHTSTFLLDSGDKPASLVKPAGTPPALSPFPPWTPCLPHAPLLLCQCFGLAGSSLLPPPPVVPAALPHSTCRPTGLVFVSIPYGELGAPYRWGGDGS